MVQPIHLPARAAGAEKNSPEGALQGVGGGGFWASGAPKKGRMRAAFFARAD